MRDPENSDEKLVPDAVQASLLLYGREVLDRNMVLDGDGLANDVNVACVVGPTDY